MSDHTADGARAESEAAGWFARLGNTPIATQTLRDFQAWRRSAANAAAYDAVEARWQAAGRLADDSDIQAAVAETLRRRPARPAARFAPRSAWLLGAGLVAVSLLAGVTLKMAFPTYSTQVGEQRLVVLRDGSRVRLNTDSQLRVRFGPGARRVILARGEAFFEAAHDPARPFIVEADGARVRAIGTKFDVRREADGVQVTLLEGRVQVGRAETPNEAVLLPNQQLTVTPQRVSAPAPVDGLHAASWTTGLLVFRGVPLSSAIQEINRYTRRKVVLDAPASVAGRPVSGSFDPGDPKAFVAAATTLFGLRADWSSRDQVRLVAAPAAGD
jgi:transmembrane sensor